MKKFFGILMLALAVSFGVSAQSTVNCFWGGNDDQGDDEVATNTNNYTDPVADNHAATANAPVNFNLTMTVAKYIETTVSPINFDFGTTEHRNGAESLIASNMGSWDLAYANCPFKATFSGSNDAGNTVPRFARLEDGKTGVYDVLPTYFDIRLITNGNNVQVGSSQWMPAEKFPITKTFSETPHNGQIKMTMAAKVNEWKEKNFPVLKTSIDSKMTNGQSADAGVYACKMTVTLAAL